MTDDSSSARDVMALRYRAMAHDWHMDRRRHDPAGHASDDWTTCSSMPCRNTAQALDVWLNGDDDHDIVYEGSSITDGVAGILQMALTTDQQGLLGDWLLIFQAIHTDHEIPMYALVSPVTQPHRLLGLLDVGNHQLSARFSVHPPGTSDG